MTNKAYEIRDYAYEPKWVHYVTELTTSTEDAWTTGFPLDPREQQRFINKPNSPKKFKTKADAKPYLDALKAARLKDWNECSHWERIRGRFRPAWKIYAVEIKD